MPGQHKRNVDGIKEFAKTKSLETFNRVDEAIKRLLKRKEAINFNSVSEESEVSKSFLYNAEKIRQRIEELRKKQKGLSSPREVKYHMTETNKDALLAAKSKRIKELEEENRQLKQEIELLRGKVYSG